MTLYQTRFTWALCTVVALSMAGLASAQVVAEDTVNEYAGQEWPEKTTGELRGTIDFVPADGRSLVINDRAVDLAPNITFNGNLWSRERLAGRLEEGSRVIFELDPKITDANPVLIYLREQ